MTRDEVKMVILADLTEVMRAQRAPAMRALMDQPMPADEVAAKALARAAHPLLAWVIDQGAWEEAMSVRTDIASAMAWKEAVAARLAFDVCARIPEDQRTLVAIRDHVNLPRGQ